MNDTSRLAAHRSSIQQMRTQQQIAAGFAERHKELARRATVRAVVAHHDREAAELSARAGRLGERIRELEAEIAALEAALPVAAPQSTPAAPLTAAERQLMTHVSMFGSDGYPLQRLGRKWTWGTSEVKGPPTLFRTKREAVASFEAWCDAMRTRLGEEAQARAIAQRRAAGRTEQEIREEIAAARARM